METAYWRIKTKAQILAAVRKMSMNSPLYSFAKKWCPSSPHENYVINQNPPTPPPHPCIDRNRFSIVSPFLLFWRQLPPPLLSPWKPCDKPKSSDPPPPDPCIDRNQFSKGLVCTLLATTAPLLSPWKPCHTPKSSDPLPQGDKLWQLPYPYVYVTQRSSSESDENDETVEDPPPDGVHYPAAINEDSKRSKYSNGDLIISYNMFSFLSLW